MTVRKVVDLVTRIPTNFSLHFSDFSKILYGFYKFIPNETKSFGKRTVAARQHSHGMATSAMAGGVARMARGDGSGRRRGRAAQLPAGPGGASSAGGATENGAGAARRGTGGPERRRGGVPGSMAPELKRKGAGEDEELTTNSFWGLIWAEKDRRRGST